MPNPKTIIRFVGIIEYAIVISHGIYWLGYKIVSRLRSSSSREIHGV